MGMGHAGRRNGCSQMVIAVIRLTPVTRDRGSIIITWNVELSLQFGTSATTTIMPTATSILQASLERHNDTFETLLSLIPARYYLVHEDNNDLVCLFCLALQHIYSSHRAHLGTTRIRKCSWHQSRRSKRPLKKPVVKRHVGRHLSIIIHGLTYRSFTGAQLNPANNKSILEIQNDQLASNGKGKQKASTSDDSDEDAISAETDFDMQGRRERPRRTRESCCPVTAA